MSKHFDIAILGTGPGGYIAALKAGQMGAKVAVVEQGHLGGACLNVGCIPSKALLASAELLYHIQHAGDLGIELGGKVSFNWDKIQARKDKTIQTLRGGIKGLFRARKVELLVGRARLDGPGKVAVTRDGAAGESFTADKIILAVGSVPSRIAGWPDDRRLVCTSDESLHWKQLPDSLIIVGGGVIGCEFACMISAFGVPVAIVEMMPRLLPEMDEQLGDSLEKIFAARGIKCFTNTKIEELTESGQGIKARLSNGQTIEAAGALVATGRNANTGDIGLETVGLTTDRGFVRVNDKMETPVKGYYCIGDANGQCLLAHAASAHGIVAVQNALGGEVEFDSPIPSCIYTFPEIASVGISQEQASARGIPVSIGNFPIGHLGKAMAVGRSEGFVKVIRHRETDKLLGTHILGHNATECIAAAGALLDRKVSVQEMADVLFAHPTISEALKESAQDALHMALHLPPRKAMRVVAGEK